MIPDARHRTSLLAFATLLSAATAANAQCDIETVHCSSAQGDQFVPASGRAIVSHSTDLGYFAFVDMAWPAGDRLSGFAGRENELSTLEPDMLFPDPNPYISRLTGLIETATSPMIVGAQVIPCAYVDTPIFDGYPPPLGDQMAKPTVGSACASEIRPGVVYYTFAAATGLGPPGRFGLRFQRGSWFVSDICTTFDIDPFSGAGYHFTPHYGLAPYCVFSCCNPGEEANNNIVVLPPSMGRAPGCYRWSYPGSSTSCGEDCGNGLDDDWDDAADCMDSECATSPACTMARPACPTGLTSGAYCATNEALAGCYAGDRNDLVTYRNGQVTRLRTCSAGCAPEPPGTPDHCNCPTGLPAGPYCGSNPDLQGCFQGSGDDLVTYAAGHVVLDRRCTGGCVPRALGRPDECLTASVDAGMDVAVTRDVLDAAATTPDALGLDAGACPSGTSPCGSATCANLTTDTSNCGRCGNACPRPANATATCIASACGIACTSGFANCDRASGNGCEVETATSVANCGACGNACSSGMVCSGGRCVSTCSAPTTFCGGRCIDLTNDPQNCGRCGAGCSAGMSCTGGTCTGCGSGLTSCDGRCVNTTTDPANCGTCGRSCLGEASCVAGACTCPSGQTSCGGTCVNIASDGANCGGCGRSCGGSPVARACVSGRCVPDCTGQRDGLYCGSDGLSGDSSTLYRCVSGLPTWSTRCQLGCATQLSGTNDNCNASCTGRANGLWCGQNGLMSDPYTLFSCSGGRASVSQHCIGATCGIRSGSNDYCP